MTLHESVNLSESHFPHIQREDTTIYRPGLDCGLRLTRNLVEHLEQSPVQRTHTPPNTSLSLGFIAPFSSRMMTYLPEHCGSPACSSNSPKSCPPPHTPVSPNPVSGFSPEISPSITGLREDDWEETPRNKANRAL